MKRNFHNFKVLISNRNNDEHVQPNNQLYVLNILIQPIFMLCTTLPKVCTWKWMAQHNSSTQILQINKLKRIYDDMWQTWYADDIHIREVILEVVQHILDAFGDHVHPHGIPCAAGEPHVKVPPCHRALHSLQSAKSARPAHPKAQTARSSNRPNLKQGFKVKNWATVQAIISRNLTDDNWWQRRIV